MRAAVSLLAFASATLLVFAAPSCARSAGNPDAHVSFDLAAPDDLAGVDLAGFDLTAAVDLRTACDLGPAPDVDAGDGSRWFATATTTTGNNWAALWRDGGWVEVPVGGTGLMLLAATSYGGSPAVVGRGNDDSLVSALYDPCAALVPAPAPIFAQAFTAEPPAAVGGSRIDMVFRGSISGDQRLYATNFVGAWQAATTLGNFLSVEPPAIFRVGSDVHTAFTGTDGMVYDGLINQTGGAATQIPSSASSLGPVAAVDAAGTTWVVWQNTDTNLVWSSLSPGGSYGVPAQICAGQTSCLITSDDAPVISLDSDGAPVIAWHGTDGITYTSRHPLAASTWTSALAATTETSNLPAALAPGGDGTDFELVYVRASDGQPRHVRFEFGSFTPPVSVSGTALASQPSLVHLTP